MKDLGQLVQDLLDEEFAARVQAAYVEVDDDVCQYCGDTDLHDNKHCLVCIMAQVPGTELVVYETSAEKPCNHNNITVSKNNIMTCCECSKHIVSWDWDKGSK